MDFYIMQCIGILEVHCRCWSTPLLVDAVVGRLTNNIMNQDHGTLFFAIHCNQLA